MTALMQEQERRPVVAASHQRYYHDLTMLPMYSLLRMYVCVCGGGCIMVIATGLTFSAIIMCMTSLVAVP